jgi:acyl-CoA reductase-like NAD-dependent aldehyde dehydrogenase
VSEALQSDLLPRQAFIDGRWVDADTAATFAVVNPATQDVVAEVPRMGAVETRRAIEAAQRALPGWRGTLAKDRAAIMRRWADLMIDHQDDLAALLTTEQGKPLAEARVEVAYAASFLEWFGEEAKRVYGDTIPTSTEVAPFGGVKESGIGREGSKYGIDEWLETKYLCMGIATTPPSTAEQGTQRPEGRAPWP